MSFQLLELAANDSEIIALVKRNKDVIALSVETSRVKGKGRLDDCVAFCAANEMCCAIGYSGKVLVFKNGECHSLTVPREINAAVIWQDKLLMGGKLGRAYSWDPRSAETVDEGLAKHGVEKSGRAIHNIIRANEGVYVLGDNNLLVKVLGSEWTALLQAGKLSERRYQWFFCAELGDHLYLSGIHGLDQTLSVITKGELRRVPMPRESLEGAPPIISTGSRLLLFGKQVWTLTDDDWIPEYDPDVRREFVAAVKLNDNIMAGTEDGYLVRFDGHRWSDVILTCDSL